MGKGFNNYMSKKDFHPSAIWNLKRVFEAQQKKALEEKKQAELRQQYEKEQDIINNKALLGDEKAKIGLAFMYDAPAGIRKEEKTADPTEEPKFDWQRKYNAPREAWAKGDESVQDQPFGIQVRNVRCVRCHKWGHINTDSECALYNMSGNKEDPGFSTNPSDIIRQMRKSKAESSSTAGGSDVKKEKMDPHDLVTDMRSEYGLTLKKHVMDQVHTDDVLEKLGRHLEERSKPSSTPSSSRGTGDPQQQLMFDFLKSLSDKERTKIFKEFFESDSKKEKNKKNKKRKRRHDTPSSDDEQKSSPSPPRRKRSPSPPRRKKHDTKSSKKYSESDSRKEKKERERERDKKRRKRHDTPSSDEQQERSPPPKRKRHEIKEKRH